MKSTLSIISAAQLAFKSSPSPWRRFPLSLLPLSCRCPHFSATCILLTKFRRQVCASQRRRPCRRERRRAAWPPRSASACPVRARRRRRARGRPPRPPLCHPSVAPDAWASCESSARPSCSPASWFPCARGRGPSDAP